MMKQTQDWVCSVCKNWGGIIVCGKSFVEIMYEIIAQHNRHQNHNDCSRQIQLVDDFTETDIFKTKTAERLNAINQRRQHFNPQIPTKV